MPKGAGFVEYELFERGYEALKIATRGFSRLAEKEVLNVVVAEPITFVVLRAMLGFTPPEWGYITQHKTGVKTSQGFIRTIDRSIRMTPANP